MKERYLVVADSVFELMITIQVKLTILKDIDTTLILTDRTSGNDINAKRVRELGLFDRVLYVKATKKYFPKTTERRHVPASVRKVLYRMGCTKEAREILGDPDTYTGFMSSEIDYFSQFMYEAVRKHAKLYLISENILAFAGLYENVELNKNKTVTRFLYEIKGTYYYGPVLGESKLENLMPIPSINENREEYTRIINHIFSYEPHKNIYKNKIIVFAESFFTIGGSDNLMDIITELVKEFGSENVMVKRHPLDVVDRFKDVGISSIEPFCHPWELFILNDDCQNCVLMAGNSTSVYLTNIWDFNRQKNEAIMLRNILNYSYPSNPIVDFCFRFLATLYERYNIPVPNSMDELIACIKKYR